MMKKGLPMLEGQMGSAPTVELLCGRYVRARLAGGGGGGRGGGGGC